MRPSPFDYRRPATVAEALADLASVSGARVLAGGQSLVPLLVLRLAHPPLLVDVNRVAGLDELAVRDGRLHVGATVRQAAVLRSPLVAAAVPLLPAALARVAHPQVRTRGTVAGSLCHHDPAAELPAVALALDAELVVAGPGGTDRVAAAGFFGAAFETALPAGSLVTAVTFPVAPPGTRAGFAEIGRKARDFALLGAGAQLTVAGGTVTEARVAVIGLSGRPQRMSAVEAALTGGPATAAAAMDAARAAHGEIDPAVPARVGAAYRRRVLPVVVARALAAALADTDADDIDAAADRRAAA